MFFVVYASVLITTPESLGVHKDDVGSAKQTNCNVVEKRKK